MQEQMVSDIGRFAIVPEWLIFAGVSPQAIRVFALLACRYADRSGVAFPSRRRLAGDLGISTDSIDRAIKELEAAGALSIEKRTAENGKPDTNIYRLRFSMPDSRIDAAKDGRKSAAKDGRKSAAQTKPTSTQTQINTPLYTPPSRGRRGASRQRTGRRRSQVEYSEDFERFWSVYPRKVEKRRAFKCWQTRLREGYTADELIRAAEAYAEECRRKGRTKDYIKHASTFLGPNKPFEDYLAGDNPDAGMGGGLIDWIPEVPFEGEGIGA